MSEKKIDKNGWVNIPSNPVTKVGVFEYLGRQIDPCGNDFGLIPDKIYKVYRPAEELQKQEFLDSLKLIPIMDGHVMLGGVQQSAEDESNSDKVPLRGTSGEDATFDGTYARVNLKYFSPYLNFLIQNDIKDLSLGYITQYDDISGVYDGQEYDFTQKNLYANHIAVVPKGRAGPDVSVLDELQKNSENRHTFTYDSFDFNPGEDYMNEKNEQDEDVVKSETSKLGDKIDEMSKIIQGLSATAPDDDDDGDTHHTTNVVIPQKAEDEDEDSEKAEDEDGDDDESDVEDEDEDAPLDSPSEAMDSKAIKKSTFDKALKIISKLQKKVAAQDSAIKKLTEAQKSYPEKLLRMSVAKDEILKKITPLTGAFDASALSEKDVIEYALKKFGLTAPKGSERAALEAYIKGKSESANKMSSLSQFAKSGTFDSAFSSSQDFTDLGFAKVFGKK